MVKEWLDRVIANNGWLEVFPMALNRHLRYEESDYCPLLLSLNTKENKNYRPFRFFQTWLSVPSSRLVVNKAWSSDLNRRMHYHRLSRSLVCTSRALKKWNREIFGFAHIKIKDLEKELETLQSSDDQIGRQKQI